MSVTAYHFWSPTCGPCTVIKPSVETLKEEFSSVKWTSVNTHDDSNGYAQRFGIQVVPTIVVAVRDSAGKTVYSEKQTGTNMSHYYRILNKATNFIKQM